MGVDAAYDGMCEVQILDHDAPMYAKLREYQVHGSVYGVIPAKRIVHKPLGEWSTEEIRVEGDNIKDTALKSKKKEIFFQKRYFHHICIRQA